MRYLWDQYHTYRADAGFLTRQIMPHLVHGLRSWDVTSAARVDGFAANSNHVADRIRKYWRREADVVHPPVTVADFRPVAAADRGEFYLWAGELAPYKRPDIAVEAFRRLNLPLIVIGGPDKTRQALKAVSGDKTLFLGKVPFPVLKDYMARCKALVFPGEEDFGIVPVEVMASGRPVIAYGRGGALDTVIDRETGLLFRDQSVEGLMDAIETFEAEGLEDLDPRDLVAHAAGFDETTFQAGISRNLAAIGAPVPVMQPPVTSTVIDAGNIFQNKSKA